MGVWFRSATNGSSSPQTVGSIPFRPSEAVGPAKADELVELRGWICRILGRARRALLQDGPHADALETIERAAAKALELTSDLLELGPRSATGADVASVIEEACERLVRAPRGDVHLEVDCWPEPMMTSLSEPQLLRLILNLLWNSVDVSVDSDPISIRVHPSRRTTGGRAAWIEIVVEVSNVGDELLATNPARERRFGVVRRLVESVDGSLELRGAGLDGIAYHVRLPRLETREEA